MVLLVGYGMDSVNAWLLQNTWGRIPVHGAEYVRQNTWGASWGEDGYMWVAYQVSFSSKR